MELFTFQIYKISCFVVAVYMLYLTSKLYDISPTFRLIDEGSINITHWEEKKPADGNPDQNASQPLTTRTGDTVPTTTAMTTTAEACKPVNKLVFIKTHKTASSTVASMFERYGYRRNLSFAMREKSHMIFVGRPFKRSMIYQIPNRTRQDFDMLVNHAMYNRPEMDAVVPNAKYITIVRDPATQVESTFGYFEMWKPMGIPPENAFNTFITNPEKYYARKVGMWSLLKNGMLFDLGFDHKYDENGSKIREKINELSKEMDLVMIAEYFDESLILLRRLLCWDFDDILYLSTNIRTASHRFQTTDKTRAKIRLFSAADASLYRYFKRILLKKIAEYGPSFDEDLAYFRQLERDAAETCLDRAKNISHKGWLSIVQVLKTNSDYCKDLIRDDPAYTALIQAGMVKRAAAEAAAMGASAS